MQRGSVSLWALKWIRRWYYITTGSLTLTASGVGQSHPGFLHGGGLSILAAFPPSRNNKKDDFLFRGQFIKPCHERTCFLHMLKQRNIGQHFYFVCLIDKVFMPQKKMGMTQ